MSHDRTDSGRCGLGIYFKKIGGVLMLVRIQISLLFIALLCGSITHASSPEEIHVQNPLGDHVGRSMEIADPVRVLNRTTAILKTQAASAALDNNTFSWRIVERPNVSRSRIINGQQAEARFELDALGDFVFELTRTDADGVVFKEKHQITSVTGPEYKLADIEKEFADRGIENMREALAFGVEKSLSFFQVDYLMGTDPADSFFFALDDPDIGWPDGGATFSDRDIVFTMSDMLEVPYDFSKIDYPDDYQVSAKKTVTAVDPVCKPSTERTLIPSEYMGNFELPEITVSDVGQGNIRLVRMKDVWDKRQGGYVVGCTNDVRVMFQQTLRRLKALGANAVSFTPWQWFDGRQEEWRVMSAEESNSVAMHDEELAWAVAEAKREGFMTFWSAQAQGAVVLDENGEEKMLFGITEDESLIIKTFEALDDWFLERGEFLEGIGVDGVLLPNWYWTSLSGVLEESVYVSRVVSNLSNMRAHFTGAVVMDPDPALFSSPEAAELIDYYTGSIYSSAGATAEEVSDWTIEDFKDTLRPSLVHILGANKPVVWDIGIPSRTSAWEPGYVEETFCNEGTSGIDGFSNVCIQKDMPTDFSFQAVFVQAALEVLSENLGTTNFPESGGIIGQYWMNDNIYASTSFPNIAVSMRAKPADYIFYRWFKPYRNEIFQDKFEN